MRSRNQKGQALVETALVLPVFLAMVLGIFGFGRLFNAQLVITNACREGARVGALGRSDTKIHEAVEKYLAGAALTDPAAQVVIQRTTDTDGTDVKVDLSYPFKSGVALPGIPDPIYLKTSAVMRVEQ
ncbi:MAG TPA: TadE family protein [Stenomitos sp.]